MANPICIIIVVFEDDTPLSSSSCPQVNLHMWWWWLWQGAASLCSLCSLCRVGIINKYQLTKHEQWLEKGYGQRLCRRRCRFFGFSFCWSAELSFKS